MKTFKNWLENQRAPSALEVGPYKIEIEDSGNGKLLLTVSTKEDANPVDSKGVIRKMIDVSSLQTAPAGSYGKVALAASVIKSPMIDNIEPVDNRGAGGLQTV